MPSVFGNVFILSDGSSVWANTFILSEQAPPRSSKIHILIGPSRQLYSAAGHTNKIFGLHGHSKRLNKAIGAQP